MSIETILFLMGIAICSMALGGDFAKPYGGMCFACVRQDKYQARLRAILISPFLAYGAAVIASAMLHIYTKLPIGMCRFIGGVIGVLLIALLIFGARALVSRFPRLVWTIPQ